MVICCIDDTVINQKYSQKIELFRGQYSGNEHGIASGIGIVNCLYFNPQIEHQSNNRLSYLSTAKVMKIVK